MTLLEYKRLTHTEQAVVLGNQGVHLGERFDREHTILLYQLDGFYVEVFYDRELNTITRLRSFRCTDQLRPYLERIPLTDLM